MVDLLQRRHFTEIKNASSHQQHQAQVIYFCHSKLTLDLFFGRIELSFGEWFVTETVEFFFHKVDATIKLFWFSSKEHSKHSCVCVGNVMRIDGIDEAILFAQREI